MQDLCDCHLERKKEEDKFDACPKADRLAAFGTNDKKKYLKGLHRKYKPRGTTITEDYLTRQGFVGDLSLAHIIGPFMHNHQYANSITIQMHLLHIAVKAKIEDIGNIRMTFQTASGNKANSINTCATQMRDIVAKMSTTAPLQIKACKLPRIAALYMLSELNHCMDRVVYHYHSIEPARIRLMYLVSAYVWGYVFINSNVVKNDSILLLTSQNVARNS